MNILEYPTNSIDSFIFHYENDLGDKIILSPKHGNTYIGNSADNLMINPQKRGDSMIKETIFENYEGDLFVATEKITHKKLNSGLEFDIVETIKIKNLFDYRPGDICAPDFKNNELIIELQAEKAYKEALRWFKNTQIAQNHYKETLEDLPEILMERIKDENEQAKTWWEAGFLGLI